MDEGMTFDPRAAGDARKSGATFFGFLAGCAMVVTIFAAIWAAADLRLAIGPSDAAALVEGREISAVQQSALATIAIAKVAIPYVVARCLYAFHRMLRTD